MNRKQKPLVVAVAAVVVILALVALTIVLIPLFRGPGVKTGVIDTTNSQPASTDLDGEWEVVYGDAPNISSVGFTFNEVLPGERLTTSGSTRTVSGQATISGSVLESGLVVVDMTTINSDREKRDVSVRTRIFETDRYPEATFEAAPDAGVDLSGLPTDGTPGTVELPGTLTIKGVSQEVNATFDVVRDGEKLSMSSTIPINRLDYGVEAPEFVAASIDEEGELNVLITLEKVQ
ncbi:YceI family protein [Corynebacterium sp. 153RC1]|uniref:YceI family protein n=1 Tax=unclassified Corynebacterium TaxID=2624378 RepID=UPI00211BA18A|nr:MULTISPECIES: YceI family protein [unclassified Corynebacterium]MCQ9352466.1 YceI family protein [Corynebacterium sp. 209RC1]MCQ9354362.1 YceI family protein [Corynebacterium sp. 1222RC1]MCQ9356749.1 YceI family protein [Corynebacterium sp. 122RC1]MCQ9358757.1 YceI family protein [Corynebacterium sp. 142RC1]MCQ9361155.1 YceI family protein [Corynebacterium sp. 153RC1]